MEFENVIYQNTDYPWFTHTNAMSHMTHPYEPWILAMKVIWIWIWKWSPSVMSDSLRPTDCNLPGSSIHGIFQARVLEWGAISFSRGSFQPRDWTRVSSIAARLFTVWATREALDMNQVRKKKVSLMGWLYDAEVSPYLKISVRP